MPKIPVDFAKVPAIEVPPSGIYEVRITGVEEKDKKDGTSTYLNVEYTIEDGPYAGKKTWGIISLAVNPDNGQPKGLFSMQRIQKALGLSADPSEVDTDEWLGQTLRVQLEKETSEEYGDKASVKKVL